MNLFGSAEDERSDMANLARTRLVCTSNRYGFSAIAYKHGKTSKKTEF